MIPPCLTLSNIRYVSRVKWSNSGKGVAPSPTPLCSSYWKGSLQIILDNGCQLLLTYIYIISDLFIFFFFFIYIGGSGDHCLMVDMPLNKKPNQCSIYNCNSHCIMSRPCDIHSWVKCIDRRDYRCLIIRLQTQWFTYVCVCVCIYIYIYIHIYL